MQIVFKMKQFSTNPLGQLSLPKTPIAVAPNSQTTHVTESPVLRFRFRPDATFLSENFMLEREALKLINDQQEITNLGQSWMKFDKPGKRKCVEAMRDICERWEIFLKKFELNDDFQSNFFLKWLDEQLARNFGVKRKDLRENAYWMLKFMESEIDE